MIEKMPKEYKGKTGTKTEYTYSAPRNSVFYGQNCC